MRCGRFITFVGPKYNVIPATGITFIFVFVDIASFAIQIAAGSVSLSLLQGAGAWDRLGTGLGQASRGVRGQGSEVRGGWHAGLSRAAFI